MAKAAAQACGDKPVRLPSRRRFGQGQWPAAARSLISPFPVSPSGGRPGRAGSPHAGSTLRASKKRWHASMLPAPPTRGLPPPCVSPAAQPVEFGVAARTTEWSLLVLPRRTVYTNLLIPTLPSPFALKIFKYSCPRRLPDPDIRAKGDYDGGLVESRILLESVYDVLGTLCIACARSIPLRRHV
jgi:hypothetical protein